MAIEDLAGQVNALQIRELNLLSDLSVQRSTIEALAEALELTLRCSFIREEDRKVANAALQAKAIITASGDAVPKSPIRQSE